MTETRSSKGRSFFIAAVVVASLAVIFLVIIGIRSSSARTAFATRVAQMGPGGTPPETIDGLKSAIATYERRIEENVATAAKAGIYWKLLAVRYMDRSMYDEALDSLKRAIDYFPEDASLFYMSGLSASILAKSSLDFANSGENRERQRLFAFAEDAHLRAISLDPSYARPKYALGVLYVFELDRPEAAIPLLTRYLELESKDVDAMFVLARAYFVTQKYEDAVSLYDRIISTTRDQDKKAEAEANKKTALDALYG